MSRLSELIAELCPEGVEFKAIKDVCNISAGGDVPEDRFSLEKTERFSIPVISNGIEANALRGYTDTATITQPAVTVSARGTIGYTELRTEPFYPVVRLLCLIPHDEVMPGFLKYAIETINFTVLKGGIPQLTIPMIGKYAIPVPPIEIQQEIVRILDKWGEAHKGLIALLTKELNIRKQQYRYYLDKLINSGGELVTLGGVAQYSKKRIDASKVNEDNYIGVDNLLQDRAGKTKSLHVPESGRIPAYSKGDILIGNIRPYLKKVYFAETDGGTNGDVLAITVTDIERVYPKFLYYVLSSDEFFAYDTQHSRCGTMPRGNKEAVMQYQFLLPEYNEQIRIASILDRFNTLCTSLTEGIPAEIAIRKQQYEYYRDKLLTFTPQNPFP